MLSKTQSQPDARLYLEDFAVGQIFRSGSVTVTREDIKGYAAQYDPQPFHLDEAAAEETILGGLAASGWHTMSLTMRLLVDGGAPIAGGIIGAGTDELRWPRPVRPGDRLPMRLHHRRRPKVRAAAGPREVYEVPATCPSHTAGRSEA